MQPLNPPSAEGQVQQESSIPTDYAPRRSRAQYAARACDECRRRKVRCSGSDPCQCCVAIRVACRFNQDGQRGRRRQNTQHKIARKTQPNESAIMNRISSLEEELSRMRAEATSASPQPNPLQTPQQTPQDWQQSPMRYQGSREPAKPVRSEVSQSSEPVTQTLVEEENWYGGGSGLLITQKRVLRTLSASNSPNDEMDQSIADNPASTQGNDGKGNAVSVPISCSLANTSRLAYLVRSFLTEHNLYFHCVDPEDFVARLSHFLETYTWEGGQTLIPSTKPELLSLAALACMVLAQAEFLAMDVPISGQEISADAHHLWYVEGRRLLDLYPKRAPINTDIVRFHLVEAFYSLGQDCLVQESINGAPQAIAMAITSAYSMNLNNEVKWTNLSKEEETSRRCLWASIYFMDRQVAYKSGRPYLIREAEVAVSDLTHDIKNHAPNKSLDPSITVMSSSLSTSSHFQLQYLQGLIEITHAFTRAWETFFSVRAAVGREKEAVHSLDALFLRIQRNLPADLSWDTSQFLSTQKTHDSENLFRVRLLLFARINLLRLAIHHASVRGRRGELPLAQRYTVAEYQYTLTICEDISCATVTALIAYLDRHIPGSSLTTYATSAVLECIYHLIAIAQLSVVGEFPNACQLSGRMVNTMALAAQTFRKAAYSNLNPKQQLAKSVLSLIEGVLSQQKQQKNSVALAGPVPSSSSASSALPSLKDQMNSGVPENVLSTSDVVVSQDYIGGRSFATDTDAAYFFDPTLLPAAFSDNGGVFDFMGNDFFQADMT